MELIEHALATGRNHFKHGKNTFLLSKELREKTANVQRLASGQADAPLLAQSTHNISRFQSITIEDFLIKQTLDSNHHLSGKNEVKHCVILPRFLHPTLWTALRRFSAHTNKREPLGCYTYLITVSVVFLLMKWVGGKHCKPWLFCPAFANAVVQ